MSNTKNGQKVLMEFIGTFVLSAGINFSTIYHKDDNGIIKQEGQPILLFLAFFSAITITRSISGGHINPAVTIAVYFSKTQEEQNKEPNLVIFYFLAQILGAISSCIFSYIFYVDNIFKLTLAEGISPLSGFLTELIATFVFTYTILCQGNKDAEITKDPTISTFIITIALFGSCGIAGNITGGCLNPAIGFAHNFIRLIVKGDPAECKYLWLYILGPSCGGFLAAFIYQGFFKKYFEESKQKCETLIKNNQEELINQHISNSK